jgi:hypothetical protein
MDRWTKEVVELLRDVEKAAWLPPAQPEKVRTVVSKIAELYRRGHELQNADGFDGGSPASLMSPRVYMLTMARLQRCLMAYLRCRMERIEALRWDVAGILPDENKAMLSDNEIRYAERCARLRAAATGAGHDRGCGCSISHVLALRVAITACCTCFSLPRLRRPSPSHIPRLFQPYTPVGPASPSPLTPLAWPPFYSQVQ